MTRTQREAGCKPIGFYGRRLMVSTVLILLAVGTQAYPSSHAPDEMCMPAC